MNSVEPARNERKSSRAGVFLLLFLLFGAGLARTLDGMDSTAQKLGALPVPVLLLVAGC